MPSKKKKYNARFPAGRIKKIMQSDEEIGKVAQAVPVIISRTLELFVESLLTKTLKVTNSRNAKTLSPSHMKQCIMAENRFDFLRELVKNIPDISVAEEANNEDSPETTIDTADNPFDLRMPSMNDTNDAFVQKPIPPNGNLSLTCNNGATRSCGTTIVSNVLHSSFHSSVTEQCPSNSKSEQSTASHVNNLQTTAAVTTPSFSINTMSSENLPPKLFRSGSVPALKSPQLTSSLSIQSANQSLPTDLRRLKHQPKSVPANNCAEQTSQNISKLKTATTVIPAPIVSIDFCSKPIIKIDYSNLALHNRNCLISSSSPSSSPSAVQVNSSANTTFLQPETVSKSAVINIDLSNTFSALPLLPTATNSNFADISASPVMTTNKNSFLELDEDYDNI